MSRRRLGEFLSWRGWSVSELARRAAVHPSTLQKVLSGQRAAGRSLTQVIAWLTGEPREDGRVWEDGPIEIEEWLEDAPEHESLDDGWREDERGRARRGERW